MSVCRQFSHRTSVSNVIQWAEVSNSAYYYRHKANRPGRKPTMYTLKEDGTVVANEEVINDINISVWIKKKHLQSQTQSTNFLRTDALRN